MKKIRMILWLLTNNIIAVSSQAVVDLLTLTEPVSMECDASRKSKVVTDRIIDPYSFGVYEVPCVRQSKPIIILIDESNRLGSVTVYAGHTEQPTSILDYFHVKLFRQDKTEAICGWWTQPFQGSNNSMRVNCKLMNEPFRSVAILPTTRTNQKMAANVRLTQKIPISEIEVVTKEYSTTIGFYGCYESFEGELSRYGGNCKDVCYDDTTIFASYRSEGKCMCGSKLPTTLLPTDACYPECQTVPGYLCGGPNSFAVYIAKAPHIYSLGCFEFRAPDDSVSDEELTPANCIKKCAKEDMTYAFLAQGEFCICDDGEPSGETEPEDCNFNCTGDLKNCGGDKTALVYTGCLSEKKESSCLDVYNCLDENIDEFGRCLGVCKDGWKGPYCLTRDLPNFTTTTMATTQESTTPIESTSTDVTTTTEKSEVVTPGKTAAPTTKDSTTAAPEKVEPIAEEGGSGGTIVAVILGSGVLVAAGAAILYSKSKKQQLPVAAEEPPAKPSPSAQSVDAPVE